jgi:hypothetical protein
MIRSRFIRSFVLVLATFATVSCSDYSPTGPTGQTDLQAPTTAQDGLLSGLLGLAVNLLGSVLHIITFQYDPQGIPVNAVKWTGTHVNQTRSVSAYITRNGGILALPTSDFTITFPSGALSQTTLITIVSDGNGYVSYDMKPHGLKFAKPVLVTQRLKNTAVYGTSLALKAAGAYFPQDPTNLSGTLKALEIETTTIYSSRNDGKADVETWQLNHFSRYMLASD